MQIAVAGVEDVGHPDTAVGREGGDAPQHLGQRGARDDAVLDDVVRADPADRGEGRLAALPEQRPLGVVLGDPDLEGPGGVAVLADGVELVLHLDRGAVELDDEDRAGALGIAALDGRLGRLDGERVHHLDGSRDDARTDDRGHGLAGGVGVGEGREEGLDRLGRAGQPDDDLGRDAEGALGADDGAEQVVARLVGGLAADLDEVPGGRDELEARDVPGREAVLEAVRPTGVLRDVAPDGADLLARRVGGVVVAVGLGHPGQLEVDHAGLDDGTLVVAVDLEDGPHPRQHDEDAVGVRQGPAGEAGARPARHEGDAVLGTRPDDRRDLLGGLGQDDERGNDLVLRQPVALVGAQPLAVGDDRPLRQQR